jgi:MFS family permease
MVIGLVATGVFGALPLVWTGPVAFLLLRAGAGLGAAIYDPAARGFLTDATPPDSAERPSASMEPPDGGLLLGPTIGAFGAGRFGGIAFVFVFSAIAAIVAAVAIALRVREEGPAHKADASPSSDRTTMPPDSPYVEGRARLHSLRIARMGLARPIGRRCGCSTAA